MKKTGISVQYFPNASSKQRKFPTSKEGKTEFAGTITDVNTDEDGNPTTVDIAVMGGHGVVDVTKVPHKSEAAEGRSYWDYL